MLRALEKGGKIKELNLSLVWFGGYGWKQLFTALSDAASPSLEELDISKNDLSCYETAELAAELAAAVVKIVRVKLMESKLTKQQSSSIFKGISQGGKRIEDLDVMFNNLSHLDPDHLVQAASRLVRLNLGWTKLNERQLERMFERLDWHKKKNGKLREN